jgi:hypothetical protein
LFGQEAVFIKKRKKIKNFSKKFNFLWKIAKFYFWWNLSQLQYILIKKSIYYFEHIISFFLEKLFLSFEC